jgi:RNA polymerase sigma factor (TIGR02999 family)
MADMTQVYDDAPVAAADVKRLSAELYAQLKRLARAQRGRLWAGQTLQTTALVSEAWLKLSRQQGWKSRAHFLNTAAAAMRQVLVDHARAHLAAKRGSGKDEASLDEVQMILGESSAQVLSIDLALSKLERVDRRLAHVVECRFFAGYSEEETARLLGLSPRTVQRDWLKARAFLYQELEPAP